MVVTAVADDNHVRPLAATDTDDRATLMLSEWARRGATRDSVAGRPPPRNRIPRHGQVEGAPLGKRAVARLVDFAVGLALFVGFVATFSTAAGPSSDGTGVMIVAILVAFLAYLL